LRQAGRRDVYFAKTSLFCGDRTIVAVFTNFGKTSRQRGLTACLLRRAPIYQDVGTLKVNGSAARGKIKFFLQNVECSAYPRNQSEVAQARAVRTALLDLQARHR